MGLSDIFQVVLLWAHALAAVAWVGGSMFYAAVLGPAVEEVGRTPERAALLAVAGREFREVVRLSILVFVVTGLILAYSRTSQPRVSTAYIVVLVVKVVLSLAMFWLALRRGGPSTSGAKRPLWLTPPYLILELGVVVYFLSLVLRVLYEQTLTLPM
jgi:uncharacterized membrane protein